ncbi:hypothetical protein, partial [Streptococcus danieliae]|uniref:hypothetical protein n=1 Tax=Streptococcus danieliae TaxID=747656 RepID=UPI001C54E465
TPIPISLVIQLGSKGKSLQFLVRLIHTFKLCFGVYTKFLTHPTVRLLIIGYKETEESIVES